jgi:cell division protein FtsW (lipid II flippase)
LTAGRSGPPAALLAVVAALALVWVVRQPAQTNRDDALPALALLLSILGLLTVERLSPALAARQTLWIVVSLVLAIAIGPLLDRFRVLAQYKYVWVLASVLAFALLGLFGQEVNGAKLWIRFGSVFQFEPVEVIKIFIVLFLAAYLAETADVIAAAKPWSLRSNAKYLGPLFLGWGASSAILVLEHDIGMAALLLCTFVAMLYVATRRLDLIAGGLAVFAGIALWAVNHYAYVHTRVEIWRNPFVEPLGRSYQTAQGLYSLAAGGMLGTGYRLGHPDLIPEAASDYVYAAWSEEFGLLGALIVLAAYALIVRRAFDAAGRAPDLYAKLLATGLASTLAFQVIIIVGGVIGALPLTGITLPFFSYGGSSLLTNFVLVALLWTISGERTNSAA